jgi:hypothetical protein
MRVTISGASTVKRPQAKRAACAIAAAALVAGCAEGGPRRARLQPTVGVDAHVPVDVAPRFVCSGSIPPLNCSAPFVPPASGHIVDFSYREWNSSGGKWCNEAGMHGAIFHFPGNAAGDASGASVSDEGSLRLSLTVSAGSYGGGGIAFEAGCVDASAFSGVQFSIAVASGSLSGCSYQLQLQTFEQRPLMPLPAGGCNQETASCYNFPAARNLAAPSADPASPTPVTAPFDSFTSSTMPAPAQLVGLQWQVNAAGGACTVELSIDDIAFIPAAAPPPPSNAGTTD